MQGNNVAQILNNNLFLHGALLLGESKRTFSFGKQSELQFPTGAMQGVSMKIVLQRAFRSKRNETKRNEMRKSCNFPRAKYSDICTVTLVDHSER